MLLKKTIINLLLFCSITLAQNPSVITVTLTRPLNATAYGRQTAMTNSTTKATSYFLAFPVQRRNGEMKRISISLDTAYAAVNADTMRIWFITDTTGLYSSMLVDGEPFRITDTARTVRAGFVDVILDRGGTGAGIGLASSTNSFGQASVTDLFYTIASTKDLNLFAIIEQISVVTPKNGGKVTIKCHVRQY